MKKNKIFKIVFCITLIFVCFSCSKKEKQKLERQEFAFGTIIKMIVYTEDIKHGEEAMQKAFEELKRVDEKFNTKKEKSIFSKLNKNPQIPIKVDDEGIALIRKAIEVSELTKGKYDITIAPLLSLWGFSSPDIKHKELPQKNKLKEILKLVNYQDIIIEGNKISLKYKKQQIDTGSFLKGYAISRAKKILEKEGIDSAFISAISSIETIGGKTHSDWRIGLQDPSDFSNLLTVVNLNNMAMGVSGDYQTFVEINGKKYPHIMDVKTGYPARNIKMLAIIAENSYLADLYSTAYFPYTPKEIIEIIEKTKNMEALVVDKNMNIFMTKNMKSYLKEPPKTDHE